MTTAAKTTKKDAEQSRSVRGATAMPSVLILTNCTDSPRGILLKKGIVILQGREMRRVPLDEQDEIKAMFGSETFQRFVDNGVFRLTQMKDGEESVKVKTPAPPADLIQGVKTDSLENTVSTATGPRAKEPVVVEHQSGGPLTEQRAGAEA